MNIAVVGSGIAGTTAAWQLACQGHRVTLFEQADRCGPVGAGILLQPSGQAVLHRFGLLDAVKAQSARVESLHAVHQTGRTLIRLSYQKTLQPLHGLGVARSTIFALLLSKCRESGVDICEGQRVATYAERDDRVHLFNVRQVNLGSFDILIAADGSNSRLRDHSGLTRSVREYPDAAFWTMGNFSGQTDRLLQIVGRDGRLAGLLPVGNGRCSFFWGLKKTDESLVRSAGINAWKQQVIDFYSPADEAIANIDSFDDLAYATYRSTRMKRVTQGRVVFIGDAAHASSPHLGQGLNLALADAMVLTDQIANQEDYLKSFAAYENARRSTTRYYSLLTAALTPFFQTANPLLQVGRDLALPIMPSLPYIGGQMALTMAGLKTGLFTRMSDPDFASANTT